MADLNKRPVKEMIYPTIANPENKLAHQIKTQYPSSEEILHPLRADTVGRWYKDRKRGIELHIAEHMNLIGMQEIIKNSDSTFVLKCGFDSKNRVDKELGGINQLRNKIMHVNRTLIRNRQDLIDTLDRLNRAQRFSSNL